MRRLGRAKREALTEMGDRWTDSQTISADEMPLLEYILRLTDIIDRMEWALDAALNGRDYTRNMCCFLCALMNCDGESDKTPKTCGKCGIPNVSEDWRVDDADD